MALTKDTTILPGQTVVTDSNGGLAIDYSAYYERIATAVETIATTTTTISANLGITPVTSTLTNSSISSSGVLTVGLGTVSSGMLLTGSGIQTAQLINATQVSVSNNVATISYSSQTVVPFIIGQFISVSGVTALDADFTGSWVVTYASQTAVHFNFTHADITAQSVNGTLISTPVVVTTQITGNTWHTNQTAMVAVSAETITGTSTSTFNNNLNAIVKHNQDLINLGSGNGIHMVGPWEWLGLSSIVRYYEENNIDLATLKAKVDAVPKSI